MKKPLLQPTAPTTREDEKLIAKPSPKKSKQAVVENSSGLAIAVAKLFTGLAIAVIVVALAVAIVAFVVLKGGGSGRSASELSSREATECFCTDGLPLSFTTAVFSTHHRPRNLGFAVFGTTAEVNEFAKNIAACGGGGGGGVQVTEISHWDGLAFTTAVTSPLRCRAVVLSNINSIPSATRTNFKSLLDHNFWDGAYTQGHLSVFIRFPPLGRGVPKEEHYRRAFDDVQSRSVLADRVLHLLNHVVLS